MRVGARISGNPKYEDTAFDKPTTSRKRGSREREPNNEEGQGHLEKWIISKSAFSSRVNGSRNAPKDVKSRDPKIKWLELWRPLIIFQSVDSFRQDSLTLHERTQAIHSTTMVGRRDLWRNFIWSCDLIKNSHFCSMSIRPCLHFLLSRIHFQIYSPSNVNIVNNSRRRYAAK